MRTEGRAFAIETALETGQRIVVAVIVAQADGAQGMQFVMDVTQHVFDAFAGVAQHFANREGGEAAAQIIEAGDGEQMIVEVGGGKRTGEWPNS